MDSLSLGANAFFDTRQTLGDAIVHAIPDTYAVSFGMILTGEPSQIVAGLLITLGISYMIIRGLWKLIASSLLHWLLGPIIARISK